MLCLQCEYLRRTLHWEKCCICKLKSALRTKKTVRVAPVSTGSEDEGSVSVEMISVRRTASHGSIVIGSQDYNAVLNFRNTYIQSTG